MRGKGKILNGNRSKNYSSNSEEFDRAFPASRSQVAYLKEHIVQLEKKDAGTKKKINGMNVTSPH